MKSKILSKLINPREINFSEAKKIFWKQNKKNSHNSRWPFHLIKNANDQLGKWIMAKIPYKLFLDIKLPYHYHGEKVLVPKKGMTLKKVYKKLRKNEKKYKKTNNLCYSKISYFSKNNIGTVFLCSTSPKGRDGYTKNTLRKNLIHIDGLHRILGEMYQLEGKKYKPINAIIAVKEW